MTFIIGTGSTWADGPPSERQSGSPSAAAEALATASEAPSTPLAPMRPLSGVPSISQSRRSTPRWSCTSWPISAGPSSSLTLATAPSTALPP